MHIGFSASPSPKQSSAFFSSSISPGPIDRKRGESAHRAGAGASDSAPMARTWDGSSPLAQAVAVDSASRGSNTRRGDLDHQNLHTTLPAGGGGGLAGKGGGGGRVSGSGSGLRALLSEAVAPSPTLSSVTGATTPSPLPSPKGGSGADGGSGGKGGAAVGGGLYQQQQAFYSLRKAFFGVLQKLLKRCVRGESEGKGEGEGEGYWSGHTNVPTAPSLPLP